MLCLHLNLTLTSALVTKRNPFDFKLKAAVFRGKTFPIRVSQISPQGQYHHTQTGSKTHTHTHTHTNLRFESKHSLLYFQEEVSAFLWTNQATLNKH